jgi:signal transduction histidine kinase
MRSRSWPVFLIALGALLGLIFVPGIAALRRTARIYNDFREIQLRYDDNARSLKILSDRMFAISILMREFLLDPASSANATYKQRFHLNRQDAEQQTKKLQNSLRAEDRVIVDRLDAGLQEYWRAIEPVLDWTVRERAEKAGFYLRQQQRPHRETIMLLADEVDRLNRSNYEQQLGDVQASQNDLRGGLEHVMWLAIALGVLVIGGSVARIWMLERSSVEQRAKLEKLSTDVLRAQEDERRMISRELHDEVGQMVTGLKMELAALARLREAPVEQFQEHLTEAKELAERTLRAVRNLAVGLRPAVLDLGLAPALDWLARDVSRRSGLQVNIETSGDLEKLPEPLLVCVYRVVQEALNNTVKHAKAEKARVRVRGERQEVRLQIQDDGVGFANRPTNGLGLAGIEARVKELGGTIEIRSAPGGGTDLHVAVSRL